ncbi:hypothetical protein F7R91_14540 [Streptomyces luteolifulvus]|uniref:Uncharacterized protein n=1 Tax=Streptomyces luteolifulvus TaxID=2615112 RepID=A0A6H9V1K2_9ACTN|nr:hypothetical protein [Streptomyces luteolifulvus]KAB1146795.1 hypothetical protein F7R91_14540 [Streptomyces luteolifulvus]
MAYDFAQELQNVLNTTICRDVRIKAVQRPFDSIPVFTVGSGLSRQNLTQPTGFPVRIDSKKPRLWMNLSYQVHLDDEAKYLTVHKSYCGIFSDEDLETCLCHFDYEREKDKYTSAHLQVHGESPALDALNRAGDEKRPLEKLHFPVGGKRFRPSLEDIIEFLIAERLTDGREGWEQVVEAGREKFQRNQLRAAMRRHTAIVAEFMREQENQG